ncbi:Putative uncharacterized protein [Halomonas sp. R57-5]|nr:Putative uncharacterized protein [Halomonas sp. R57-5]
MASARPTITLKPTAVITDPPSAVCQSGENSSAVSVSTTTATCPEARSIITARQARPLDCA